MVFYGHVQAQLLGQRDINAAADHADEIAFGFIDDIRVVERIGAADKIGVLPTPDHAPAADDERVHRPHPTRQGRDLELEQERIEINRPDVRSSAYRMTTSPRLAIPIENSSMSTGTSR